MARRVGDQRLGLGTVQAGRAGRIMGMAAETFNDGLRAYYLSFAVVGWFFSAWAFIAGTVTVLIEHPDESLRPQIMAAAKYCPTRAIRIIEED